MIPESIQHRMVESLDGTLTDEGAAELAAYLAAHPEAEAHLEALRRDDLALESWRTATTVGPGEPEVWDRMAARAARDSDHVGMWPRWVAAAAAVLVLAVGWSLRSSDAPAVPSEEVAAPIDLPAWLQDSRVQNDFDVIRELDAVEQLGGDLDLAPDRALYDVVSLQLVAEAEAGP